MITSNGLLASRRMLATMPQLIATSTARAAGASVTCAVPTGAQAGDLLIAVANQTGSTTAYTMNAVTGWTETLDTNGQYAGYLPSYDGTTANYTFTKSNAAASPQIIMMAFRNAAFNVQGTISAATTNPTAPAITLTANGSTVIACFNSNSATYPTSRSYSLPANYIQSVDTDNSLEVFYRQNVPAGTTGTVSTTSTSGTANRGYLIGIRPN